MFKLLASLNWPTLAVLGLGVLWVLWKLLNRRIYAKANAVRHKKTNQPIPTLSFWKEMWMFMKIFAFGWVKHYDAIADILEKGKKYGRVFNAWQGFDSVVIVSHPDDLKLWVDDTLFSKDEEFFKANFPLYKVFGQSVVSTTGEVWERQRKSLRPSFSGDSLRQLVCAFSECASRLADEWDKRWDEKRDSNDMLTIPVFDDLSKLTLDAIGMAGFGHDFDSLRDDCETILKSYKIVTKAIFKPLIKPWMLDLPLPYFVKLKKAWQEMDAKLEMVINNHKTPDGFDILGHLLELPEGKLSKQELRDNLLIFIVAGHDTCTSTLVSALYFMALYPEIQAKVLEEVHETFKDEDFTDLDHCKLIELAYTRKVVKEVVRLHPPVDRTNMRTALKDVELGDYKVPAGTKVMPFIPLTNYDETNWQNPKKFDPERWHGHKCATNQRTLMSFSTGSRTCLGKKFSILEVTATLAMLVLRFEFSLVPGFEWKSRPITVCLRPIDGLPLQMKKRNLPKKN